MLALTKVLSYQKHLSFSVTRGSLLLSNFVEDFLFKKVNLFPSFKMLVLIYLKVYLFFILRCIHINCTIGLGSCASLLLQITVLGCQTSFLNSHFICLCCFPGVSSSKSNADLVLSAQPHILALEGCSLWIWGVDSLCF